MLSNQRQSVFTHRYKYQFSKANQIELAKRTECQVYLASIHNHDQFHHMTESIYP
jgi:hypothetical protein